MNATDPKPARIDVVLIASGKYHDTDFARLELLKLLAQDECMRVRVFEDYANLDAIRNARFLVTYTCDVIPSLEQQEALRAWVERGGRWLALHGTNSILRFLGNGLVDSPAVYRWSSYRHHAFSADDPLVRSHARYEALAADPVARRRKYVGMVAAGISERQLARLRGNV